jgi:MoxR-like ATPase
VVNYVQRLAEASRQSDFISLGLSPRGALAVIQSAKAWAFLSGRDYLLPDDIQAVFPSVVSHRLLVRTELGTGKDPATELLSQVDVLQ